MSVHSVRFIVAPNSFPVMPDPIGHLPSAKVVIIIEKRCRSIAFVAQSQTSNLSIPTAQARLQGLQADPRRLADALAAHKSPCKTSASTAVRRLALMGVRNQKIVILFIDFPQLDKCSQESQKRKNKIVCVPSVFPRTKKALTKIS